MTVLEGYLTKSELASQLRKSTRTIDRLERMRTGPPRIKIGKLILYRIDSVQAWLASLERGQNNGGRKSARRARSAAARKGNYIDDSRK